MELKLDEMTHDLKLVDATMKSIVLTSEESSVIQAQLQEIMVRITILKKESFEQGFFSLLNLNVDF